MLIMNWRIILGLALMLFGIKTLYTALAGSSITTAGNSLLYAKIACIVWIVVGLYLLVKGMTKNSPNQN